MIILKDGRIVFNKSKYVKREKTKDGYRYYYKEDAPRRRNKVDIEREQLDSQNKKTIKDMSKQEILELKNDNDKMGKFLMDNQNLWIKIAKKKGIRKDEIEDASQEIMIKVYEGINKLEKLSKKDGQNVGSAFYNYVSTIANNSASDYKRKKSYKKKDNEVYFEEKNDKEKQDTEGFLKEAAGKKHEDDMEKKELKNTFHTIMDLVEKDLTKAEKDVLKYIKQGFNNKNIGEALQKTSNTINTIKNNIKQKMQDVINKYAIEKSTFLTLEEIEYLEKSFDVKFPKRIDLNKYSVNDYLEPIFKSGEWIYLIKGKKNLPVGTKRVHNGVTMVKQPDKTWKPEKKGKKPPKEDKPEKKDKPKFKPEMKGKIKAFIQKFIDFIGDIFTAQDVGVSAGIEAAKEATSGGDQEKQVVSKPKEDKPKQQKTEKQVKDTKVEENRKKQVKENIKKDKE